MRDDIQTFDFDEVIDRRGTHSAKYDAMGIKFGLTGDDLIPMWVADMDFRAPPAVNQAIQGLIDHGVHGYFGDDSEVLEAVANWTTTRHGWTPEKGWITSTHGLVSAIGLAIQAMTEPTDGVIVFAPVYHMFGNKGDLYLYFFRTCLGCLCYRDFEDHNLYNLCLGKKHS